MKACLLLCLTFALLLAACGPTPPTPQADPLPPAPSPILPVALPSATPSPAGQAPSAATATKFAPASATAEVSVAITTTAVVSLVMAADMLPLTLVATRNTYYLGLGPQMSQPCHLLYYDNQLKLDPRNCPLRLTLTDRVGVTRYFGLTGQPGTFAITPDLPAYRKPGFALLACPVTQYNDNICEYALTDDSGTYRLEIRVTGVE